MSDIAWYIEHRVISITLIGRKKDSGQKSNFPIKKNIISWPGDFKLSFPLIITRKM